MDIVDAPTRRRMMQAVGQKGTAPELAVRRLLRELGVGYRTANRNLPGSPDVANRRRRWAVFVNGCFWHGHRHCAKTRGGAGGRVPESNAPFWRRKLAENRARDARKVRALRGQGFRVLLVWECELKETERVRARLRRALADRPAA